MTSQFNKFFTIGNSSLDEDHRTLITKLIDLKQSAEKGVRCEDIRKYVIMLQEHFAEEESLMPELYELKEKHVAAHKKEIEYIEYLLNKNQGKDTISRTSVESIKTSLLAHIGKWDSH